VFSVVANIGRIFSIYVSNAVKFCQLVRIFELNHGGLGSGDVHLS
jgi:hypothetical protein